MSNNITENIYVIDMKIPIENSEIEKSYLQSFNRPIVLKNI